jgi:cytochrome P450
MSAPAHPFEANRAGIAGSGLPPGPAAMPFLGVTGNLLRFYANPIPFLHRLERRYGTVATLARGHSRYIAAFGAAHNRLILGNPALFHNLDATTMPVRVPAGSALARLFNGLTHMNGARHEQQRRLIAPAFSRRMVESYLADITVEARRQVKNWRFGECRDVTREMSEFALSIAIKILLGIDPAGAGEGIRRLFREWVELVFSISTMLLPWRIPGLPFRKLLALSELLEAEVLSVIARKRAQAQSDVSALSALLQAHDHDETTLSDDEIVGQTAFLFMAAQSTTTNALAWTLFLLERHPKLWDAVVDECSDLDLTVPAIEQLQKMTLLDAVARESIRLMPPIMLWCKIASAPFEIRGYSLPAGTNIFQSALMTQRDPTVFPEPNRFLPDRWFTTNPDPFQFCAFSAGPRMCLGSTLAMIEIKVVVATIIRQFRLALVPGRRIDVRGPMFLSPTNGLPMNIHPAAARPPRAELRGSVCALVDFPERDAVRH